MGDSKRTHYEVSASRESPQRARVTTDDGEFVIGRDGNPVEYLLGSVLACLNSTATMVARDMDIEIETLEAAIEGEVNYGKYLGKETDDRPGLQGLDVTLSVETAGEADLDAWLSAVEERCPVSDNVSHETDVSITLG
jgi:uncharacterized OsmC-like protein